MIQRTKDKLPIESRDFDLILSLFIGSYCQLFFFERLNKDDFNFVLAYSMEQFQEQIREVLNGKATSVFFGLIKEHLNLLFQKEIQGYRLEIIFTYPENQTQYYEYLQEIIEADEYVNFPYAPDDLNRADWLFFRICKMLTVKKEDNKIIIILPEKNYFYSKAIK